jgi:hypothetical protein
MMQQPYDQSEAGEAAAQDAVQPRRKTPRARLILLALLGIPLVAALAAGGFVLFAHRTQPTANARPPLYASSLTRNERAWQCERGASCIFDARGLHILATTDHLYFSTLSGRQFGEQVIDVQAKLDNGDPEFVGLVIGFRSIGVDGYGFLVYANGRYELVKWDQQGIVTILVPLTLSSAVHTGLNQINHLKVIARGDQITIFINGEQLQQITDATYASGNVLLGAARYAADAVFSNLTITSP